ncbi:MAG: hypothetical protein JF887_01805 [Candidatus Dormibacteraeota bacterium]|uniref:Uncharacterized protein n=1 Tax=Candidatus Amunia macphersoniae TaxID=3127014 RepID=A0A934N8Q7_9BACT|nr:hypothetical protein [Candidatus Dormibacteraeota bacterium]
MAADALTVSTIRGVSTEVPLGADDGLRVASVANLDYLQLVGRPRLLHRVG